MIFGILAIRFNGKPSIHVGVYFAYLAIILIGLYSNKHLGTVLGAFTIGLGFLIRKIYPVISSLSGEKLDAFLLEEQAYNDFISKYIVLLILFGALVGLLSGSIGELIREDTSDKFSANRITHMAILVALGVIINTVRVGSVSFGGFPIILSGYLFGPVTGFIVGGVTDVVAFIVRPSSYGFNPIFTLTSALTGAIPVIVTNLLGEKYPKYSFVKVLIGIFIGQILTSVLMVPFFSQVLYKRVFLVDATKALIKQLISIPIYTFLAVSLNDRLSKVIRFDKI